MGISMQRMIGRLSFQNRMRALLFALVGVEAVLLLVVSGIFIRMVSNETYSRNRVQLSMLSNSIKGEFTAIDDLVAKFHQDPQLQDQLRKIDDAATDSADREMNLISLESNLGWLAADSKISSWILFNDQNKRILGSNSDLNEYIKGYRTKDYLHTVAGDSHQAQWIFDPHSNRAVYVHNLFETQNLMMKKLGTIVFTVDFSFIREFMDDTGIFSAQDFMVMSHGQQYYSTSPGQLAAVKPILKQETQREERLHSIRQTSYYVITDPITLNNTPFQVHYFIVNRRIIARIIGVSIMLLLVILFVLGISIYGANYLLRRLVSPINMLAKNMHAFKSAEDLGRLREQAAQLDDSHQQDEIGTLYTSFQRLMAEIDRLVVKDYQSQLLTQEMENRYLMAQIDPHFLYNTLNSVNWIALSHNDTDVSEVVTSLAVLLREMANGKKQFNTLAEELAIVQAYIKIQSVRFEDRLLFNLTVPPQLDLTQIQVPKLIIQPIVENAVKYGVEKTDRPVVVEVALHISEARLLITVFNDGDGFDPKVPRFESTGVGLHNIASRLRILYGTKAGIDVQSAVGDMTTVTIWLPINERRDDTDESSESDHR